MKSRGVCTTSNDSSTGMDSNNVSPDAKSTPYCGSTEPMVNYRDRDNDDNNSTQLTDTARSGTIGNNQDSSCSSAVIYKMTAHGNRRDRSPNRIEFQRVQRIHNGQGGCFLFRKNDTRYKFSKHPVVKDDLLTRLPPKKKNPNKVDDKLPSIHKEEILHNTSSSNRTKQKKERLDRVELYYFDRGNSGYFCTTDCPPQLSSDYLAQQTTDCATKFWAEFYGSIHIAVAVVIAFILQTFRFLMYSVVRPTLVGSLQIMSDYGFKPLLTVLFNGFLQPPLILGLNVLNSLADMLEPLARTVANFMRPLIDVCKAFRFVEISHYHENNVEEGIVGDDCNGEIVAGVQLESEEV